MADTANVLSPKKEGIEYKKNPDGSTNAKYIDILEEDRPIAAQKFVCMSFVSPEKIIKQRETFMFNEYVKQWDMNKSLEKFNHFINFLTYKYSLDTAKVMADFEDFCKSEKDNLFLTTLEDEYKTFLDKIVPKTRTLFDPKFRGIFCSKLSIENMLTLQRCSTRPTPAASRPPPRPRSSAPLQ